jgi:beta-phosphoglucomutase-like phosphatase (HAD superfamily)
MNRGKEFENFLQKIFESMPNVLSVQNGFGWRSDQGADLIVEFKNPILEVNLTTRLIIQAKSYEGSHYELNAVDQIREGIEAFKADGGLLITTAESTEELERKVLETSEKIGKTIDIMAGADVAKFVLTHAPHLLVGAAKL